MYYPPGNNNNNSSFNNQPTQFGNYSPPPPPGQFGYPQQVPQKKSIGNWFKGQKKGTQIGIGCGIVFLALTICTCSLTAIAGGRSSSVQTASSNIQTTGIATAIPTMTPITTPIPTHATTSTAIPTVAPTPTPIPPTPTPTRPPVPTPTPVPTQPPVPTPTTAATTGVNGNPWGYDFTPGNLIYNPPANFCTAGYFNCIASFWQSTNGYVDECQDGTYSHSGGRSGACSHHGGEMRPLYSH